MGKESWFDKLCEKIIEAMMLDEFTLTGIAEEIEEEEDCYEALTKS